MVKWKSHSELIKKKKCRPQYKENLFNKNRKKVKKDFLKNWLIYGSQEINLKMDYKLKILKNLCQHIGFQLEMIYLNNLL